MRPGTSGVSGAITRLEGCGSAGGMYAVLCAEQAHGSALGCKSCGWQGAQRTKQWHGAALPHCSSLSLLGASSTPAASCPKPRGRGRDGSLSCVPPHANLTRNAYLVVSCERIVF